jgi:hypothetical protein
MSTEIHREDREGKVLLMTENDEVFDYINKMDEGVRKEIFKTFDEDMDKDGIAVFKSDEGLYGYIYKFAMEGDTGLILALSDTLEVLQDFAYDSFLNINEESAISIPEALGKL